jgi:hypothetical protein
MPDGIGHSLEQSARVVSPQAAVTEKSGDAAHEILPLVADGTPKGLRLTKFDPIKTGLLHHHFNFDAGKPLLQARAKSI